MMSDDLRAAMRAEFKTFRMEMRAGFKNVRTDMKTEGETTRRHFDIMVEKVNESVKLVAEATAHNSSRLSDHERRLTTLEKPGRG